MPTHSGAADSGPLAQSVYTDEKEVTLKFLQLQSVPPADQQFKRIPALFLDTSYLQHSTMATTYASPSAVKPPSISATLPDTLLPAGYLGSSSFVTTKMNELRPPFPTGSLAPSSTFYQYAGEQPQASKGTFYTPPKDATASKAAPEVHASHSHMPVAEIACTPQLEDIYSSSPLEFQNRNTVSYRLVDPQPEAATTVTRYVLPSAVMPKVLPRKEVEYCTVSQEGRHLSPPLPSVTTYILPSAGKASRRRNGAMGKSHGICRDWVLPCLDTLFAALSRACNCDVDIVPSPQAPFAGGYAYAPDDGGDAICLSCGEVVNTRMLAGMPLSARANRPSFASPTKEAERGGRIPLPVFACSPYPEPMKTPQAALLKWISGEVRHSDIQPTTKG
ncbi:hypothetical protein ACSSS7_006092 [Eimeria intestinalis]